MTIKDETDAYENWRNLGTSVKKRKSYYGAAAPEILHVTEGKKIKIGILTNGNLLHKCVNLNKKKYRFVDTCPLDSVIQGLTTTYCDSNVVQICMEQMLSPQVVEIVKQLATGTTKLHTYKLRGEIYLSSNFEFRKTTLINNTIRVECAMNAVNVLQYFLGDDFHSTCTTNICDSKECDVTHQTLCSKTIPININIIKKNGFKDLIQSAEDCLMFNKCNFTTELSNILFIDTCDCGTTSLLDIPLSVKFKYSSSSYLLRSAINFIPPIGKIDDFDKRIGHYTCLSRRVDGTWEVYNDLEKKKLTVSSNTIILPHLLIYSI
ncbi:hypothetical protein PPYR_15749 [Photinus pyralis]|uniref:Uncharacterized protein n=1 Tax=Photinus pyralis TaxID=7054 RepID=A0A5N3ZY33_PHOPY|nr:hypothetical protein PPYR_15749 [Photinus pyralis]